MTTLLLCLAVGLSLISGSIWLVAFTLTALLVQLYPVLLVLVIAAGGAFLFMYYRKR